MNLYTIYMFEHCQRDKKEEEGEAEEEEDEEEGEERGGKCKKSKFRSGEFITFWKEPVAFCQRHTHHWAV